MRSTRQGPRFDLDARGSRRALGLILAIGFTLFLVAVDWGLPSWRGWAPDEIDPQAVLKGERQGFAGHWTTRYPPLHYYLLATVYWFVRRIGGSGLLGLDEIQLYNLFFLAGRLLSVLLATATVWLVYRCSRVYQDRFASCLAAAAVALMVPYAYYAKTVNLEAPYLFWFAVSLLFFIRIVHRHRLRDYLLFTAAAACAVCTKDQAYALYVLPLLIMPAILLAFRRRREGRPGMLAGLTDRRLWLSAVLGVAIFLAIHKLPFDLRGFRHHIAEMMRVASPAAEFANSVDGHLSLAFASLRFTAFNLGWPLFAVALGGLAAAMIDFRAQWRLLAIGLFPISYYLFFIAVIRYSYDRFFLPISLVLAIFAASCLARILRSRHLPGVAAWALLIGVFGFAMLRAVSVDAKMLADSRYAVEDWLEEHLEGGEVAVIAGRRVKLQPRGYEHLAWQEKSFESVGEWLHDRGARFLVIHPDDPWVAVDPQVQEQLNLGDLHFRPDTVVQGVPVVDLLRLDGIRSNLSKINAPIVVATRSAPWGGSVAETVDRAVEALSADDPAGARRLAQEIATSAIPGRRQLVGDLVVGLSGEGRRPISRNRPAVIVVTNPSAGDLSVDLSVVVKNGAPGVRVPVTVRAITGATTTRVAFDTPTDVRVGPVAPGESGLFVIEVKGDQAVVLRSPQRYRLGPDAWVIGLTPDLWTQGEAPAVVVIENSTAEPRRLALEVASFPGREAPSTVVVSGRAARDSFEIPPRRNSVLDLPPAAPFGRTAFVLTALEVDPPADNPRALGFRIIPPPAVEE